MTNLPSHRQFINSLLGAICGPQTSKNPEALSESRPLHIQPRDQPLTFEQAVPPSKREVLLTLHVLFPNLLLPALDLLDRELITRLTPTANASHQNGAQPGVYLVKSLASTMKKKTVDAKTYFVRLESWNCTCASFALEAYQAEPTTERKKSDKEVKGGFGGMSKADDVPCCKHLLACLLAQDWQALLGGFVREQTVTREELAGIIVGL